ncbi:hypothetical protein J2X98_004286 [Pseudarthrobacter enclensis]|uniref:Uncharacterized protein n=1 Tax=Pseudarthrobacter enclensis TaxID=993070 RepID=A0ABT9RZJ6_9MICC|nr:hypothetical protein [Pseudarthrobacter enclensis]
MPTITKNNPDAVTEESLKEWAMRIAAEAPPLSDDQFHQLHALFVVVPAQRGRRIQEPERRAA